MTLGGHTNSRTAGFTILNALYPEFAKRNVPQSPWFIPSIP